MSDDEEYGNSLQSKQRRPERSCDGDGSKMPDARCSNCLAFGTPCTYLQPTRKRGPKNRLVEELKKKNALLDAKLRSLSICSLCAQPLQSLPSDGSLSGASVFHQGTPESDASASHDAAEPDKDDFASDELASRFSRIAIDPKLFGLGSSFALANNAIVAKEKLLGQQTLTFDSRRPMYWDISPWELATYEQQPRYIYPDNDLISSLLHLYFINIHPLVPILHRPSFVRSVAEGLHFRDPLFGSTLLVALAVASRYSDDPRVFADGHSTLSSGWKFVDQVEVVRKKCFDPTIHDVQFCCLMSLFCIGTSAPQRSWVYLGLAIRYLQQHGEHKRKRETPTDPESELWNRAFWSTVCLEGMSCAFIGRPTGLHVEDYDADPPLEVDDEFWDQGFAQPPDRPSFYAYFTCYIRLMELLGDAMRRLYGSKKKKQLLGWSGPEWEQRVVADLDSAMNECFDSIPTHLRWGPDGAPKDAFFDQSFTLQLTYHYIQIVIHRPYIHKQSALAAPSLSICAGAARAIVHTADAWCQARQQLTPQFAISPLFVSAIILMMNTLGDKRAGPSVDKDKALATKAMEIIKFTETRYQTSGRLWEMLRQLQSNDSLLSGKQRLPQSSETQTQRGLVVGGGRVSEATPPGGFMKHSGSTGLHGHFPSVAKGLFEQQRHGQQLFGSAPLWSRDADVLSSDLNNSHHDGLKPGMSIEELLAEAGPMDSVGSTNLAGSEPGLANDMDMVLDDELMAMWMAVPTDFADINQWGEYLQNRNMPADVNWRVFSGPQ
ncbi:fungal-specific transcription factor domain-containing protein [Mycena pura]|uniref:Fungal-specific transcription factor domain-containing protein n=1 Tax=Mycena pura TaxID=153505 RepID=A0AAD6VKD7_9AGAR|nr:fungal-specific transcription factor domain-containing protein [Mycena pura]